MALVKSMKEIESIIVNGGRCSDGTPYSPKDAQNVQQRLITQDELPLLDVPEFMNRPANSVKCLIIKYHHHLVCSLSRRWFNKSEWS